MKDQEANRFSARARRYANVGTRVGGVAARMAGGRMFGGQGDRAGNASALAAALGGLKGPIMKVAQLLATIPDALPPEYANELIKLQSQAPPMGWAFVKRRMQAELGPDWQAKFAQFEHQPAAAASLGQVHKARALNGEHLACKLQYPDMQSAVEADLGQLQLLLALRKRFDSAIDTSEIAVEIAARLREELDYLREARHVNLYRAMLADEAAIRVPKVWPRLSTGRLLTLDWLEGDKMLAHKNDPLAIRNRVAAAMFTAWWLPFCRFGVIHGDPHLGNYTVFANGEGEPAGINLLDYGCVRIFPPRFVGGVVDLYHGLLDGNDDLVVRAYETWGFKRLNRDLIEALNIWARFIYGPLLDDRVRTIADGVKPSDYGRKEAFRVHRALKELGPVTVPREFVFMDRAAVGLGAVFLHLSAELNFHRLFSETIEKFDVDEVAKRQAGALARAGLADDAEKETCR
jgi:predicted unusual protein kinase regulating ubiquinone biosynthesis (AarF/ABC1/UbiB family)